MKHALKYVNFWSLSEVTIAVSASSIFIQLNFYADSRQIAITFRSINREQPRQVVAPHRNGAVFFRCCQAAFLQVDSYILKLDINEFTY